MTREWPSLTLVAAAVMLTLPLLLPPIVTRAAGSDNRAVAPASVMEFTVIAEKFMFTPEVIEVNRGDTVRITVKSVDTTHGWEVKAYDIDLLARRGGRPESGDFVAEKAGTFPIECSEYCGKGHKNMKGTLVVKEAGQ